MKAYTTRVGAGPFPSELFDGDPVGDLLIERGHEYGTNTGRRRRVGWLDLVMIKHAARLNTHDRTRDHEARRAVAAARSCKICVAYEDEDGKRYEHVPYHQSVIHKVRPIYETLPGWETDIDACRPARRTPGRGARLRALRRGVRRRAGFVRRRRPGSRSDRRPSPRRLMARVLLVGSGGREHALGWGLTRSAAVDDVISAPGNPGLAELGECIARRRERSRCGCRARRSRRSRSRRGRARGTARRGCRRPAAGRRAASCSAARRRPRSSKARRPG